MISYTEDFLHQLFYPYIPTFAYRSHIRMQHNTHNNQTTVCYVPALLVSQEMECALLVRVVEAGVEEGGRWTAIASVFSCHCFRRLCLCLGVHSWDLLTLRPSWWASPDSHDFLCCCHRDKGKYNIKGKSKGRENGDCSSKQKEWK